MFLYVMWLGPTLSGHWQENGKSWCVGHMCNLLTWRTTKGDKIRKRLNLGTKNNNPTSDKKTLGECNKKMKVKQTKNGRRKNSIPRLLGNFLIMVNGKRTNFFVENIKIS